MKLEELLVKAQKGQLCKNCYGCCGNNKIDFSCKEFIKNFKIALKKCGWEYKLK